MGHLNTIVCAAAALVICSSGQGFAQGREPSGDRFTSRDVLAMPEQDQRVWMNALIHGIATGMAAYDDEAGACVSRWYFGDEAQAYANVHSNMERYPDHHPSVIVLALARRECPALPAAGQN